MGNAKIIYFDGPDGAGKTTQLELAQKYLEQAGHNVKTYRAMGGSPIGEELRKVALAALERPPETDMHIALACQYALLKEISNLADEADIILIDRSPLSILAYQTYADGMDRLVAEFEINKLLEATKPALIIVYNADAVDLNERRSHRNNHSGSDYFETKSIDYHQAVCEGYEVAAKKYDATVIDASKDIDTIHKLTVAAIEKIKA